ncbi:MAG: hypothetical protein R6U97_06260, partial [Desulfosalsimonas sp.]
MQKPDPQTGPKKVKGTGSDDGIVLFLPFEKLPENPGPILQQLSLTSDINPGDLRYRLAGRGLARLSPDPAPEKINNCVRQMQELGLTAAEVSKTSLTRPLRLLTARKVKITESAAVFFDRQDKAVLSIDQSTDLLLIAADLSGKAVEKPNLSFYAEAGTSARSFEEALKRISAAAPSAVFFKIGSTPPQGAFLDHT